MLLGAVPSYISLLVADLDDLGPPIGEENSDPVHGPRRARHNVINICVCLVRAEFGMTPNRSLGISIRTSTAKIN